MSAQNRLPININDLINARTVEWERLEFKEGWNPEKTFKGPVNIMLTAALNHIKSQFIKENIQKFPDRAEAERRYNYPYAAIEEILIEVRILPDKITIGSFPGPDRSISAKDIDRCRMISRRYRNRRIGEFLKELDMTEGRGTGMPKILRAVKNNESPRVIFHTDEARSYFVAELPVHPKFLKEPEEVSSPGIHKVTPEVTPEVRRLLIVFKGDMNRQVLQKKLGLKAEKNFRLLYLHPALKNGLIEMTIPGKPQSSKQKYRLTEQGSKVKASL